MNFKFSTLLADTISGLPICKQVGQSSQFAQDAKAWAPRLLFWHGLSGARPLALPSMGGISLFPANLAQTT